MVLLRRTKTSRFIDLTGKIFGKLIVIKYIETDKRGNSRWLCRCECGNKKIIYRQHLINGNTRSCGCLRNGIVRNFQHGHSKKGKISKIYDAWHNIIQRCNNFKNPGYKYYGGRGIQVCKRWLKFENFLKDVGEIPKGKEIDRINNDKGYNPNNFRLVSPKENTRNKSNNHILKFRGEKHCISAMAEKYNIPYHILQRRIWNGWSIKRALLTPVKKNIK